MSAIICPICDQALKPSEGLLIRPIDNGTTDIMRILHVEYSVFTTFKSKVLHESDEYDYLSINTIKGDVNE